MENTTSAHKRL